MKPNTHAMDTFRQITGQEPDAWIRQEEHLSVEDARDGIDEMVEELGYSESQAADLHRAIDDAFEHLSEPSGRYIITDASGEVEETIAAATTEEAEAKARDWLGVSDFDVIERTLRVHGRLFEADHLGRRIAPGWGIIKEVEPIEPPCGDAEDGAEHDYRTPHEVVGGSETNPGVWGTESGGITSVECCIKCGLGKHTASGVQDSYDASQGHTEVRYVAGEFKEAIEAARPQARLFDVRIDVSSLTSEEGGGSWERYCDDNSDGPVGATIEFCGLQDDGHDLWIITAEDEHCARAIAESVINTFNLSIHSIAPHREEN